MIRPKSQKMIRVCFVRDASAHIGKRITGSTFDVKQPIGPVENAADKDNPVVRRGIGKEQSVQRPRIHIATRSGGDTGNLVLGRVRNLLAQAICSVGAAPCDGCCRPVS